MLKAALTKWIKHFSEVKLEYKSVLTAKQIQELPKRNAQFEGENLILKIASAIFMQTQSKSTNHFINKKPSKREIDNQCFRKILLEIYMKAKNRIGTRAFKIILLRDYCF